MKRLTVITLLALVGLWHSVSAWAHVTYEEWLPSALCVHKYEGSWHDKGAPYYGGMQMDRAFMRRHGRWAYRKWGTADRWPVRVQLHVAYRGWRVQGWGAWPNTARTCGLR